jgi:hypothetical protein
VVILARTRQSTRSLNYTVRARLLASGRHGEELIRVLPQGQQLQHRISDQVVTSRNPDIEGLLNGTRATVTSVSDKLLMMSCADGREHIIERGLLCAGLIEHTYAMRLRRAQGMTLDMALLWAEPGLHRGAAHVGPSRARHRSHVYLPQDRELGADRPTGRSSGHEQVHTRCHPEQSRTQVHSSRVRAL